METEQDVERVANFGFKSVEGIGSSFLSDLEPIEASVFQVVTAMEDFKQTPSQT